MATDTSKSIVKAIRVAAGVLCIVAAALMLVGAVTTRYPFQFQSGSSYTMVQASGQPLQYVLLGTILLVAGALLLMFPWRRSGVRS